MVPGRYTKGLNPKLISCRATDLRGAPTERATDGGCETDLTGFASLGNHTGTRITTDHYAGIACAEIVSTGVGNWDNTFRANYNGIILGQKLHIEFAARSVSGNTTLTVRGDGNNATPRVFTLTSAWQAYQHDMEIIGFTGSSVAFSIGGAGTFRLDVVSIKVATNTANRLTRTLATTPERTYEVWIKPFVVSAAYDCVMAFSFIASLQLKKDADLTKFALYGDVDSGTAGYSISSSLYNCREWHHIACTYSDSGDRKIRFIVDGVEATCPTQVAALGTLASGNALSIGATNNPDGWLQGIVGEVRISNIVRTAAELKDCYRFGIPTEDDPFVLLHVGRLDPYTKDQTSNGNDLTAAGTPIYTEESLKSQG